MVNEDASAVFVDTNVLVYARVAGAPVHQPARDAIQRLYDAGAEIWISRQVPREYLAVLTRPQTFAKSQPIEVLTEDVRLFERRFRVAKDGPEVMGQLLSLLQQIPVGGGQVHDANIIATMLAHDISRLLTHNVGDFARFARWITILPLETDA